MSATQTCFRTSNIHDVIDIVRNTDCDFDPEPSTLPAVR